MSNFILSKKIFLTIILASAVIGGLVLANREIKNDLSKKPNPKPLSAAESNDVLKKWQASPDGIKFREWEESAAGKKVYAGAAKIREASRKNLPLEGVITSLSLPPGSRLGFGVMVKIDEVDYILSFGLIKSEDEYFHQLKSLQVNDQIVLKNQNVSYAPKYAYPILSSRLVERSGKVIYKRVPQKGGC
jgi:hypothetical protein